MPQSTSHLENVKAVTTSKMEIDNQPNDSHFKQLIRTKLKEIMTTVDLEEVTIKFIRSRLEEELNMTLTEYKSYIDDEMLTIMGQMETATQIFDYLYLGSAWNASNYDELKERGVGRILNVSTEIDNYYPETFDYLNVRVNDDDSTELLFHWEKTYRYICKSVEEGSKVLVHCRMGISRSASVVIAYAMKANNWSLSRALQFVKNKRECIKPNESFLKQLEVYDGILCASKQRHNSLWSAKHPDNKLSAKPTNRGALLISDFNRGSTEELVK